MKQESAPKQNKASSLYKRRNAYRMAYALDRLIAILPDQKPKVLVTGYWRSGTTWVQQVIADGLEAKTSFEPLGVLAEPPFLEKRRQEHTEATKYLEAYMPLSMQEFNASALRYLDQVFNGYCPAKFSFLNRTSVLDSLHRRTVVKLIRSPFILGELIKRYNLHAVHVTRHPCAVVASMLNAKWRWSFDDVKFSTLFPDLGNIDQAVRSDIEYLISFDEAPKYEKVAAFWAVTEKHVAAINLPDRLMMASYEQLVQEGSEGFGPIMSFLGKPHQTRLQTDKNSLVSMPDRKDISKSQRINSWKDTMDKAMQTRIQEIIIGIWPEGSQRWFDN